MKKILYLFITIFLISIIIIDSNKLIESIRFSFNICINNLFPSFIPFMFLSNFLINYNFTDELSDILKSLMKKFKISKNCSIVFIMSLFSGTPTNAIYINNLLNNNLIDIKDAENCLYFCHFSNPIFVLSTIGYSFLGNKEIGLKILIAHYTSAIIIGIFNKKRVNNYLNLKKENTVRKNFITILKNSIISIYNTLIIILGIITFFIIITTIINNLLNIATNYKFIYGILEITQGLKYLSLANISINFKAFISVFLISFGGLSIHLQVFNIIDNKKIRYVPYLLSRIIHGILSCIILYPLINY